jgi:hypothetical protein
MSGDRPREQYADEGQQDRPECPLCGERAHYEGWVAVGAAFCDNDDCPIEEWDHTVRWIKFECIDCGENISRPPHQMDVDGLTPKRCASCTFDRMAEP